MSLYKHGSTWWIRFTTPSGQLVRQSAQTEDRQAAEELHDKLKAESWRVHQLGEKPKRTWDEAAYRWLLETEQKASHRGDVQQVAWLQQFFWRKFLADLTREAIAAVGEVKRREASPSTANRYLAMIRAILRRAALDGEWIDKAPLIRLYPEPKRRVRWLTPDQVDTLLGELPDHLAELVRFSLATGLRQSNVRDIEWSQIDMQRKVAWIHADQAKGRRPIRHAQRDSGRSAATADRQASEPGLHLQGEAHRPGQHQGLEEGAEAGRNREFPVA